MITIKFDLCPVTMPSRLPEQGPDVAAGAGYLGGWAAAGADLATSVSNGAGRVDGNDVIADRHGSLPVQRRTRITTNAPQVFTEQKSVQGPTLRPRWIV